MRVRLLTVGVLLGLTALLGSVALTQPERAEAVAGSQFDPGNIISDEAFFNGNAMSEGEIQAFLDAKVGNCQNSLCLNVLRVNTPTIATQDYCNGYAGGGGEAASAIIFKVQQTCGISAKVILVTLQKEQGLVTRTAPSESILRKAMGMGCPDTSVCDSEYYGFFNQVYAAARQLNRYNHGSFTWFKVGQWNNIQWHPNGACGSGPVLIKNKATAALYYYTPYQPNAAALANLGGTGDGCSSYGNRNFWVYYNDWFGSPTTDTSPFGNIEAIVAGPGSFRAIGWAIDPDTRESLDVHVYAGAAGVSFKADRDRSDVGAAYPGSGSLHGFDATVPASSAGANNVCVYAINKGAGANTLLGCRSVQAMSGAPVGELTAVTGVTGGVQVSGWAVDPDSIDPISVHLYVGATGKAITAKLPSDAAFAKYPGYGKGHGFQETLTAAPGSHTVCAYAINVGVGSTGVLGCKTVTVPGQQIVERGRVPVGSLEVVSLGDSEVNVTGWALDPDTAAPISVHVYVGSDGTALTANKERTDVSGAYPGYGAAHGFTASLAAKPGKQDVCAYAINTGPGGHSLIGCKSLTVPQPTPTIPEQGRAPIGNIDSAVPSTDGITVSGWAIDPDTAAPISVHVYVDSSGVALMADQPRPDVAAVYPAYGAGHGYVQKIPAGAGKHSVCAYAINAGPGGNTLVGCKSVVVPAPNNAVQELGRAPIGNLEAVSVGQGGLTVSGWALDPDSVAPNTVHIYVDEIGSAITADSERPDIAVVYPAYGSAHGYSAVVAAAPGPHTVCAYSINTGPGGHTLLGCIKVTV